MSLPPDASQLSEHISTTHHIWPCSDPALTVSSDTVPVPSTSAVEATTGIMYLFVVCTVATSLRKTYSLVEIVSIKTLMQGIDHLISNIRINILPMFSRFKFLP